jgi:hypothetical protein
MPYIETDKLTQKHFSKLKKQLEKDFGVYHIRNFFIAAALIMLAQDHYEELKSYLTDNLEIDRLKKIEKLQNKNQKQDEGKNE